MAPRPYNPGKRHDGCTAGLSAREVEGTDAQDAQIKCKCGKVEGVARQLSPASTNHILCSCKGCQSYAHYLGQADDMLDENGGSNIFQMNPANFEITTGMEHVACMKVTKEGPLRWFAACCKTPLGNTFPRGGVPFLGVLPICLGHKGTSETVVGLVGPIRAHTNQRGNTPFGEKIGIFFMMMGLLGKIMKWRIAGGRAYKPFFNAETMRPITKPIVISDAEREALEAKTI